MTKIAILGGGIAGLGAAFEFSHHDIKSTIFEKADTHGGHAKSYDVQGFVYDDGPHVSFTKNERVKQLFAESVEDEYLTINAQVNNYWKGLWIKHPVQCNLFSLPIDMKVRIIEDFVNAGEADRGGIKNYADWLLASYGRSFAENFPMEYTKKYHTTTSANMDVDWLGPRLYRPSLSEVLHGAFTLDTDDVHYVPEFRYPRKGGFVRFLDLFAKHADIRLEHEIRLIDLEEKKLYFKNGQKRQFDHIVSSLPLPELIKIIKGAPDEIVEASEKLACTTLVIVNVGLDRSDISEAHWSYFYDDDICFSRLSFPSMQSPFNAPENHGIIQAELYFSKKYKPFAGRAEDCITPTIRDLKKCRLVSDDDHVVFADAKLIPYANIIFDLDRRPALNAIQAYLSGLGIECCGRYGLWGYHWTDQSFLSGEKAARRIMERF